MSIIDGDKLMLEQRIKVLEQTVEQLEGEMEGQGPHINKLRDQIKALTAERDRLREAAQALVDAWDIPWSKDAIPTGGYVLALRDALGAP